MTSDRRSGWLAHSRTDVLLVLLILIVAGPIVQILMAHQASRLAFTAALSDRSTVQVDAYEEILGVDFAERDGHLYSDKAPGQPFLAVPFYAMARSAGAEPGEVLRYFDNYTLWWTSFWSAVVPAAALAVLMRRFSLRVVGDPKAATAAALATSLSTLLLPFATVLFSHVLAAALCFGAYVTGRDPRASNWRLAAAGLLGGLAVVTEYTTGIVVVLLGALVVHRHGARIIAYIAGGLPAAAALALYNTVAWGSPTAFSYDFSATFADFHNRGLFGIRIPDPGLTLQVLVGERGLWTLTPVVLVGVLGLIMLARSRRTREPGVFGLIVFAAFVAVQGGWFSVTAGASPGPRYVVAGLPFVAVGVAKIWTVSRVAVVVPAVVGAIPMLAAIFTNPLAQPTENFAAGHWMWRVFNGNMGDTLLSPYLPDPYAQVVQLALAAMTLGLLWRVVDRISRAQPALDRTPLGPAGSGPRRREPGTTTVRPTRAPATRARPGSAADRLGRTPDHPEMSAPTATPPTPPPAGHG